MCGLTFHRIFPDGWSDIPAVRWHLGAVFHTVHSSAWQTLIKNIPIKPFSTSCECPCSIRAPWSDVACPRLNTGWHPCPYVRVHKCVAFTFQWDSSQESQYVASERVFWGAVPSFSTAVSTLCQSSLDWLCQGSPFVKWNKVLAAKAARGSVSLRRYQFSWWNMCKCCSHGTEKRKPSSDNSRALYVHACSCLRRQHMWNVSRDSHAPLQRRKHELFFVNADFVLRSVAGLITHVCDFRQLAFWHGKQLAESVDYLPK